MEMRLEKVLRNCRDGAALLRGQDEVLFANDRFREFVGKDVADFIARLPLSPESGSDLQLAWGNESGPCRLSIHTSPVILPDGMTLYLVFCHAAPSADDPESKALARGELEKLKNDLISIVSHELRTPLAIVKSSVENLRAGVIGQLSEKQARVLDTALRNVDRLGRIIHDFLDLSRLEAGVARIHRRKIDLDTALARVLAEFRATAREKGVVFDTETSLKVPSVLADPGLIVNVFQKLIANAVRHARRLVSVRAEAEREFVKVTVSDDGPGIPADQRDQVFKKFTQLDRAEGGAGYKGTGLGLAICHEIVHLHQGEIWVECGEKGGTDVHVLLPAYQAQDFLFREIDEFRKVSDESKTPFALLALSIRNYPEIKAQAGERDIAWMHGDLVKTVDRMLRPEDRVLAMEQPNVLHVLLAGTDRKQAHAVVERLHRMTKDCFCPARSGRIFLDLSLGVAVYPNDTADPAELVKTALDEAV